MEWVKQIEKLSQELGVDLKNTDERQVEWHSSKYYESRSFQIDNDQIVHLNLDRCGLTEIPEVIFEMTSLKELILSNNSIVVTDEILVFTQLEVLDLSYNGLEKLPEALFKIKTLRALILNHNQIIELQPEISGLTGLQTLDLSHNQITYVPPVILELNELWLNTEVYQGIKMGKEQVVRSQKYEEAAKLRDKEKNLMATLRYGLVLDKNEVLNLPPELMHRGKEKIAKYWEALDKVETVPLSEFKLILMGEGGAGKTSLLKRLVMNEFDLHESQTHGINIMSWNIDHNGQEVTANVWDFGGQEIMHATHQFFLSNRSLYVIVVDGRKEEKVEYWLKYVEAFGGASPVVVVINKIDENPGFDLNRKFLFQKYPNIVDIVKVSCLDESGLTDLLLSVKKSLERVSHLNTPWPKPWVAVKNQIQNTGENFIKLDVYKALCAENEVYRQDEREILLQFLNDLGIMLNFKEIKFANTNVLNPQWITKGVYKILNSKYLADHSGVLAYKEVPNILPAQLYPESEQGFIISLMEKFELCFSLDQKRVLVPDLLDVQEPEFDFNPGLKFIFQYDFLPRSILPRLIVRLHRDIEGTLVWRTGVVLSSRVFASVAKISVDYIEKAIIIEMGGERVRDYFATIRHTLLGINQEFTNLNVKEKIPVGDDGHMVSYHHLLFLEERGETEFIPEDMASSINVSELLGNYVPSRKERIEEEILSMLRQLVKKTNDRTTLMDEANRMLELKPNIFGIGINLNGLIDRVMRSIKGGY